MSRIVIGSELSHKSPPVNSGADIPIARRKISLKLMGKYLPKNRTARRKLKIFHYGERVQSSLN
ncbi:MAG: hypothetical protein AB1743_05340 [Actinomycetota bacterium]